MLVDHEIRKAVKEDYLKIFPFTDKNVGPNSYDVTLGSSFIRYNALGNHTDLIDPRIKESIMSMAEHFNANEIAIRPGEFLLATTEELIVLPDTCTAMLEGRSSLARLGLTVHQTGGFIDAGFMGRITLEIYNANARPILLRRFDRIGQLVFIPCSKVSVPYGRRESSKYQGQEDATVSMFYKDYNRYA